VRFPVGVPGRGRSLSLEGSITLLLLSLSKDLGVLCGLFLVLGGTSALHGHNVTLALQTQWGDETLDLGSLEFLLLLTFFLWEWTSDNILSYIIFLRQVEEGPDLASSLGSKTAWDGLVGQAWDIIIAFLDDDQVQHGQVGINDASSHRFSLAFSLSAWSVAGVTLGQKQTYTGVSQHSLFHWETLLVVSSADPNNVSFPLITETLCSHLCSHTLLIEWAQFLFIVNLY